MAYNGIDVSTFQGNINWSTVAVQDITFAMIRASYGRTGVDDQFENNMTNIVSTSVNPGAYHYTYALDTAAAVQEANHFLDVIKGYKFTYPVALDIEYSSIGALGIQKATDIAEAFCNTVQNAGYYVVIYANLNWLVNYLDMNRLSVFDVWLAQWSSAPTYQGNFGIWQYTSTGRVNGIYGDVDRNLSYRDYPTIITAAGLNGTSEGSVTPTPPTPDPDSTTYTVSSGDTLWGIAERFLGNGSKYTEIKTANNLTSDTIYPGQILVIPNPSSSSPSTTYTVASGDTLWGIAERFLGNGARYTEIKAANSLSSDTIYPGQVLAIPSSSGSSGGRTYTVVSGDTLWGIAERFLGNGAKYPEIKNANGLTGDMIYPGQVLIIP